MEKYSQTIRGYHELAKAYEEKFMNLDYYNESYDAFMNLVSPTGAKILEVGCGPGNIARYMMNFKPDWKWLATDAAPAMVELAKLNNPTISCRVLQMFEVDSLNTKFDALVAGFCIPYISKEDLQDFVHKASACLQEAGIFYVSFIEGSYADSGIQTSSDGKVKMQVYYYSEEDIQGALHTHHFSIEKVLRIPYPGTNQVHAIIIARKIIQPT